MEKEISPKDFLEKTEISIFNLISSLQFLHSQGQIINTSSTAQKLICLIGEKLPEALNEENLFKEKIESFILVISQRISDAVNGTCQEECSNCFIASECKLLLSKNKEVL